MLCDVMKCRLSKARKKVGCTMRGLRESYERIKDEVCMVRQRD